MAREELKDHDRSWCASTFLPVAAEKPTATIWGKLLLMSTLALTRYGAPFIRRVTDSVSVLLSQATSVAKVSPDLMLLLVEMESAEKMEL